MKKKKLKKHILFSGLLSLALVLTACSGGEEEPETETQKMTETETEYVEEIPTVKALDEAQPIPADTGTLELKEHRFESANLILQLPEGVTAVEGEPDELCGYVTVTDDAGEWELKMEAFLDDTNVTNNVAQNWYAQIHKNNDPEAELERFSKKIDWSEDVAGTIAGYSARVWANNTAGNPYESNPLDVPAVDIVIDYGDQYVGRYYGLYMRLQFQHPVENDNIYEILHRRAVRAIINNFSVIEAKEPAEYTANGVTVSLPARWNAKSENRTIAAVTREKEKKKSFVTAVNPTIETPEKLAATWGEVIQKQYGERTWFCVIHNIGTEDAPQYSMYLYTDYDQEEGLVLQISAGIQGATEEEQKAYLDDSDFAEIMESIQIDPIAYSATSGAKAEGFKVQYGRLMEYTGTEEHVVVPSVINGFTVEEIDISAFQDNIAIKSVELPDTITWIDHHAFEGCTGLETVKLPDGITVIDEGTFEGCKALKDVVLPESVTEVGKRAFYQAGTGTFEAKGGALYGEECFELSGFSSITLADGSDLSAKDIFREAALGSVQLPSDLTVLGEQAFYFCGNLTELKLPDTVTAVGAKCFSWTQNLRKLTLSKGLTELPEDMTSVSGIVNLSIPSSVTHIQKGAVNAEYVFLYNKEVHLEDEALDVRYLYLDGAYTPEDVPKNIEKQRIFKKIYIPVDATVAQSDALDAYYYSLGMDGLSWFGPSEALYDMDTADYVAENQWLKSYQGKKKIVYIPAYTENGGAINWISSEAFAGNTTIEEIWFTAVNSINPHAFEGCTNLKKMYFGMASFSFLDDAEGGIVQDAFVGVPENVTVYFPASLTDEEFQTYEAKFRAKGMPESTKFDTFSLEEQMVSHIPAEEMETETDSEAAAE